MVCTTVLLKQPGSRPTALGIPNIFAALPLSRFIEETPGNHGFSYEKMENCGFPVFLFLELFSSLSNFQARHPNENVRLVMLQDLNKIRMVIASRLALALRR